VSWSHSRLTIATAGNLRRHALDLEPNYGTYACQLGLQCLFESEDKGYPRLAAAFSYRVCHGLELYGWINDFLDKHHEEVLGYPALPLNFIAGMRFRFPAD